MNDDDRELLLHIAADMRTEHRGYATATPLAV